MNSRKSYRGAAILIVAAVFVLAAVAQTPEYRTSLTKDGRGIVRRPEPADFQRGALNALPVFQPGKREPFQNDLRGYDLSALDLSGRIADLLMSHFDDRTQWPDKLPAGFDPRQIMEIGKNPGLGVRKLRKDGITGRGVGVAVIDQGLLVDHIEYQDRLRLYEEIHCGDPEAQMHGPAVASIAVGKTVGVAPEADLYYVAETHGLWQAGKFDWDFTYLARSVDRILEVNHRLPEKNRIRVISISVGWSPQQKGYPEVTAAVERAKKEGVFVVSSSLSETYERKLNFHGLGREPMADPDRFESYRPGLWWADQFYAWSAAAGTGRETLLVPMDSRATASPTGPGEYVFYRQGGWSWSIPYIAGLFALACQVKPEITPEAFWVAAIKSGDSLEIPARRPMPPEDEIDKEVQKYLDESIARLKQRLKENDLEKTLAEAYNRISGQKVETMTEADFRSWAAGQVRETVLADTKPHLLKTIVNPVHLIESLKKLPS
jgi:hypothetical protein